MLGAVRRAKHHAAPCRAPSPLPPSLCAHCSDSFKLPLPRTSSNSGFTVLMGKHSGLSGSGRGSNRHGRAAERSSQGGRTAMGPKTRAWQRQSVWQKGQRERRHAPVEAGTARAVVSQVGGGKRCGALPTAAVKGRKRVGWERWLGAPGWNTERCPAGGPALPGRGAGLHSSTGTRSY